MEVIKNTMRHRQAVKSKQKIAKTAIALFRKHGYRNVTVNDICKKADVAVGSFYHYFETKGAVFQLVIDEIDKRLFAYLADAPKRTSYLDTVHDFILYFAKSHLEIELDALTIWLSPEFRAIGDRAGERTLTALCGIIEDGQKCGEVIDTLSVETMTYQVFIGVKGIIYDWCLHSGSYDLIDCMEDYCKIILRGLRAG